MKGFIKKYDNYFSIIIYSKKMGDLLFRDDGDFFISNI